MADKKNPLKGMSRQEIVELIADADFDPEDEETTGPLEIVIRGADAEKLMEMLSGKPSRTYDPDADDGDDGTVIDEVKEKRRTLAERLLGVTQEAG